MEGEVLSLFKLKVNVSNGAIVMNHFFATLKIDLLHIILVLRVRIGMMSLVISAKS